MERMIVIAMPGDRSVVSACECELSDRAFVLYSPG